MRKIVFFDSKSTGHHLEYLKHIVHCAEKEDIVQDICLVVNPNAASEIEEELGANCVEVIEIRSKKISELHGIDSLWRRSLQEWSVADKYARKVEADHCVLMSLNWFQFALGFPSARAIPYTLSGIYFFPYVRLELDDGSVLSGIRYQVRCFRKWAVLPWMMQNPKLRTVFVLNDPVAATQLNRRVDAQSQRFQALPDPVMDPDEKSNGRTLHEAYDIDEDRCKFLFIGTISERKGILAALDAFKCVTTEDRSSSVFLILGRLKGEVEGKVKERIRTLREMEDLQIRTDFRLLSDTEFRRAVQECDVITVPYQRTEGSSGILGHAARARRPVIGPRSGLIGNLIQRYGLGASVDASQPEEIGLAIKRALHNGIEVDRQAMQRYLEQRRPSLFAKRLFDSVSL